MADLASLLLLLLLYLETLMVEGQPHLRLLL
jgi:hypothetical protein